MEQLYNNQIVPYYRAPHIFMGFPARYTKREWSDPLYGRQANLYLEALAPCSLSEAPLGAGKEKGGEEDQRRSRPPSTTAVLAPYSRSFSLVGEARFDAAPGIFLDGGRVRHPDAPFEAE